ncbi:MAG: hydantoinase/oxoprolinase family protein [Planctomycetota bacterium]
MISAEIRSRRRREPSHCVGVDVGGANLKYYFGPSRRSVETVFPMWKQPDQLADQLTADLQIVDGHPPWAVTMTGELADCFRDRQDGVQHIVGHVMEAARRLGTRDVRFYGTDGSFHDGDHAVSIPNTIAAANWHALASAVGCTIASDALLLDVGSTTTDLIPIRGGQVDTHSKTDYERLRDGSLVYVGCRRTPVCGLVDELEVAGQSVPIMNEWFATVDDAVLWAGHTTPEPSDCETADGRSRTRDNASRRLAKMIGCDVDDLNESDFDAISEQIIRAARDRITSAVERIQARDCPHHESRSLVVSGHGNVLTDAISGQWGSSVVSLSDELGSDVSRCAPSWAVVTMFLAGQHQTTQPAATPL